VKKQKQLRKEAEDEAERRVQKMRKEGESRGECKGCVISFSRHFDFEKSGNISVTIISFLISALLINLLHIVLSPEQPTTQSITVKQTPPLFCASSKPWPSLIPTAPFWNISPVLPSEYEMKDQPLPAINRQQ